MTKTALIAQLAEELGVSKKLAAELVNAFIETIISGVKSEGELIISGTKGYIYVPAPWWLTDFFEVRYEDQTKNKNFQEKLRNHFSFQK